MEARSQRTARGRAHRARHHGQRASRSLWPALPPGQLRLRADGRGQQLGEGATRRDGSVMDGGFNGEEGGGGTFFYISWKVGRHLPKSWQVYVQFA